MSINMENQFSNRKNNISWSCQKQLWNHRNQTVRKGSSSEEILGRRNLHPGSHCERPVLKYGSDSHFHGVKLPLGICFVLFCFGFGFWFCFVLFCNFYYASTDFLIHDSLGSMKETNFRLCEQFWSLSIALVSPV